MEMNRRRLMEVIAGALAAVTAADATGSAPDTAELKPILYDPSQLKPDSTTYGTIRIYCNGPTAGLKNLQMGSIDLKPGEQPHPPHTHPDEELLLVTEGTGQITLNGEPSVAGPGVIAYVPSNVLHGILNTSDKPLKFTFVKWIVKST
jgi:quercetin dioxygenase-like cupin family protein